MNLFDKIYELCEKKAISVHKLEVELGFGNRSIYKWKFTSPSIDKVKAVADYFGVTVDYLLRDDQNEYDEKAELLQHLFDDKPEMRMLFSVTENATPEQIRQAAKIIEALKDESENK